MKKKNRVSGEDFLALLERLEAQSLKEGDTQILKAQGGDQKDLHLEAALLGGQDALPGQAEAAADDPTTGEIR